MKRISVVFIAVVLVSLLAQVAEAQMNPNDLARDFLVELVMKDSTTFFGIVLVRPVPDRVIFQTRYGRLEIPIRDISYFVDYRFNYILHDDIMDAASKNTINIQKNNLNTLFGNPKADYYSIVHTATHDIFRGARYLFDDSAHIALSTDWGDLIFGYENVSEVENYSGTNDTRNNFYTSSYLAAYDPRSSQAFIVPTAFSYGAGNNFLSDYYFGGLQANFGPTDWLSTNLGGVFLPLKNNIIVATAGLKVTPYSSDLIHIAIGAQGLYSEVVNTTKFGVIYGAVTYGTWDANLTLLAAGTWKNALDSDGVRYNKQENVLAIAGCERLGENLKLNLELMFIQDFDIVPVLASIRYFQRDLTIDIGVVFSLYESGAARTEKTLGEYVFNAPDFPLIPLVSGSYHF